MNDQTDPQPAPEEERSLLGLVPIALVAIAMVVFIVQNTHETGVEFVTLDQSAPTWLIIVISAVAGAILGQAAAWMRRRSKRSG